MKQLYKVVVKDGFELAGTDRNMPVDLSFINPATDCTFLPVPCHVKAEGKEVVTKMILNCTATASQLQTQEIQGNKKCVSITGIVEQGTAEHTKADGLAVCLADDTIQWATVDTYQGKGTLIDLQAAWVTVPPAATGVVQLKAWWKKAGQDSVLTC